MSLETSRPTERGSKILLYVDALNYLAAFFPHGESHWGWINGISRVRDFVSFAQRSGYDLKVFIDNTSPSEEARRKWKKRRVEEITKEKRNVPLNVSILVGDMFSRYGVAVLFSSTHDNDDTLCLHAQVDGASVLSNDQDMFRYEGATYDVYGNFELDYDNQMLVLHQSARKRRGPADRSLSLNPPPSVVRAPADYYQLKNDKQYTRGAASALVKKLGNLHASLRPLRQALYARLGFERITEVIPFWDKEAGCVTWEQAAVQPNPALDRLLDAPMKAVDHFFPAISLIKPLGVSEANWQNHLFAAHSAVFGICVLANRTGPTLLELLLPVTEDRLGTKLATRASYRILVDITRDCRVCGKPFIVSASEQRSLAKKKHSLPKDSKDGAELKREFEDHRRNFEAIADDIEREISQSLGIPENLPHMEHKAETPPFEAPRHRELPVGMEFHKPVEPADDEFMESGPLLSIVSRLLAKRYPMRKKHKSLSRPLTSDDIGYLTLELRQFKILTTHRPEFKRQYRITEFSKLPANEIMLDFAPAGRDVSVEEYFDMQYKVKLLYPNLPCVAVQKLAGWTYLPIEVCEIVEGQRLVTKYFEHQEPVAQPANLNVNEDGTPIKKKKSKAEKAADAAVASIAAAADKHSVPVQDQQPKVEREHSLYRDRRPPTLAGITRELWDHRKALRVCLRCGHPSHCVQDCLLKDDRDGSKDWNAVQRYRNSSMAIPTVPKQRLSDKCGIPQSTWSYRRAMGHCLRCDHPGHGLPDCRLLQAGDFDGKHTWVHDPEYYAASDPGELPVYPRVPHGFAYSGGRYKRIAEDGTLHELEVQPRTVRRKDLPPVEDQTTVSWDEANRAGNGGSAKDEDVSPEKDARPELATVTEAPVDGEGYSLLLADGSIKKKVLEPGQGPLIVPMSVVQVHYNGWVLDDGKPRAETFDSSYNRKHPFEFVHQTASILPAWEVTIGTMRPGEKCEMICGPERAYGEDGCEPQVPPNATLKFHIEVLNVETPLDPIPMRLKDAEALKVCGSNHLAAQNPDLAITAYQSGLDRLGHTWGSEVHEEITIAKLRFALNANLALAALKVNDADLCLKACEDGLMADRNSAKLHYRRGLAWKLLEKWEEAKEAFRKAAELDPSDKLIRKELENIATDRAEAAARDLAMARRMVDPAKNKKPAEEKAKPVASSV
ncbi:hypothetical protein HKX48_000046 [Thoreauomyces humboldtii]|nr:hypothetical protein HKX48_000046 [Thoreauomyces humboldtii]